MEKRSDPTDESGGDRVGLGFIEPHEFKIPSMMLTVLVAGKLFALQRSNDLICT
jgi:hypothetical protein